MTTKAKDGRETLQERLRRSTARMANECSVRLDLWCEHSSVCLQLANDHDAAQAEIARLKDQVELAWHEHSVAVARIPLPVAEDVVECDESNSFVKPKSSKRYKLVPVDQPEAAPEGLIRNAALQEAAAHLRDMGYWTQASAVLSLCTNASAPTPASAVASEAAPPEFDVHAYVQDYEFAGDGGDYRPNEKERALIEDAIHGALFEIGNRTASKSSRDAGLEEAAKICDALYGRHNEWATTTSKTVKTKADRAEMKGRADAAQFLAHRIRALASTPAPASAQDLVKALEQIRVVCLDNTASERPDLALKFVSEVAEKALSATGGAK